MHEQLRAVDDDVTIDSVKINVLSNAITVDVVESWLRGVKSLMVVLGPLMIASSELRLLNQDAEWQPLGSSTKLT